MHLIKLGDRFFNLFFSRIFRIFSYYYFVCSYFFLTLCSSACSSFLLFLLLLLLRPHHHHRRRFPAIAILVAPFACTVRLLLLYCWLLGSCNKSWSRAAWVRARWLRAWKKDRDRFPVCTCSRSRALSLSVALWKLELSFAIYLAYFTVPHRCYCLFCCVCVIHTRAH